MEPATFELELPQPPNYEEVLLPDHMQSGKRDTPFEIIFGEQGYDLEGDMAIPGTEDELVGVFVIDDDYAVWVGHDDDEDGRLDLDATDHMVAACPWGGGRNAGWWIVP